jgi:carboxyl-terminal processing protease
MTIKTRLSVLFISTPVLAFVIVGALLGQAPSPDDKFQHLRIFEDVVSLVMSSYVEPVNVDKVMEGAMRGLADGLDADSAFLTPAEVKTLESTTPLPAGDVGIELTRQYYLRVIAARDGSPAAKAGLHTGDYVRAIDGKPTRDLSVFEGTRLLRGQPGTPVTLTIIRGNAADPHDVTLSREKAAGPLVSSRLIGEVGYVRIASFRADVTNDLRSQIAGLTSQGAKSLALDVRSTAEGPLENGIAAARLFVKSGTLAQEGGRKDSGAPKRIEAAAGDGAITLPAVLLVSNGTAGPAEVFAAALDGNGRADLVGEHTLGRAGVQKLVKLPENTGLWLTHLRYLTPDGTAIHGRGLQPDVAVEEPSVEFGATPPPGDPILDEALSRLHGKAAA